MDEGDTMNEPMRIGDIMNASTCPKCGTPRGNLPWCTTCATREAVTPLANLTGFCRANTTCPECGTTVYEGWQAYVTPFDAPLPYLYVALHPMCGPQVRDEIPDSSRDTRDA
jgi:hypothetical protein